MTSTTKILLFATTAFLIGSSLNCASLGSLSPLALENRTLRISQTVDGLEYQYWVCAKRVLGFCTRSKLVVDYYDLKDKDVKKTLSDKGFFCQSRMRQ